MDSDALDYRLAKVLFEAWYGFPHDPNKHSIIGASFRRQADAALAALGLDDLGAAVERFRVEADRLTQPPMTSLAVQCCLEAALTATPESENSDG